MHLVTHVQIRQIKYSERIAQVNFGMLKRWIKVL